MGTPPKLRQASNMNLLLIDSDDPDIDITSKTTFIVRGRRFKHLKRVLKVKHGQKVRAAFVDDVIGSASVLRIENEQMTLALDSHGRAAEPPINCRLVLALPRPQMFKRILQQCATLGVRSITLIHTQRVEKSFWQSPVLSKSSIREQLILGAEQAVSSYLPDVQVFTKWHEFLEAFQKEEWHAFKKIVLHPKGESELEHHHTDENAIVLAIGPEGGFIGQEIESLQNIGFEQRTMGKRILKVETAVVAALSKLF